MSPSGMYGEQKRGRVLIDEHKALFRKEEGLPLRMDDRIRVRAPRRRLVREKR
jgi:hypothetical protein